jgi:tripartite-type tricarboxylate transporter receptor subunit TctC
MKLPRRSFLRLATGAAALLTVPHIVRAQSYPTRPVRVIVGFAAGGSADIVARLIGQWLSERLDQPFVIENRPGAASNMAADAVAKAPPDGYTLLCASVANAINATIYNKVNFNFLDDIAPVAGVLRNPYVMEVNPLLPTKTVSEFIAYARANPTQVNMASGGIGTGPHMAGELFNMMAGVRITHVTYRGTGPAITDLLGGQLQVMFDNLTSSVEHIRAGRLRALAVTTTARSEVLPDIPTVGDFLPGYEASSWVGICAPRRTPPEIIDRLNKAINECLASPTLKARLAGLGGTLLGGSPSDFGKLIADETEKWSSVSRAANLKAE